MKPRAVYAAALPVMLGALLSASAEPPPLRGYSGVECVAKYGAQQSNVEYYGGSIHNLSTTNFRDVRCPIVRNCTFDGGIGDLDIYIDDPVGESITCTFYARSTLGNSVYSVSTISGAAGEQLLTYGPQFDYNIDLWQYYIDCSLPKYADRSGTTNDHGGRVWAYTLQEGDGVSCDE